MSETNSSELQKPKITELPKINASDSVPDLVPDSLGIDPKSTKEEKKSKKSNVLSIHKDRAGLDEEEPQQVKKRERPKKKTSAVKGQVKEESPLKDKEKFEALAKAVSKQTSTREKMEVASESKAASRTKADPKPKSKQKPKSRPKVEIEVEEIIDSRRLYRSRSKRIIGGVAGGIGEYLGIDPTIVRAVWAISALIGAGIIAYIIAWMVIPLRPAGERSPDIPEAAVSEAGLVIGLALVGLGAWFLLAKLDLIPPQLFVALKFLRQAFWPVALILTGAVVIIATSRGYGITLSSRGKVLYRSTRNTKVAGVAGGISDYFGIDATLVRLAWVALTLASVPAGIVAYTVAAVMIPKEPIN